MRPSTLPLASVALLGGFDIAQAVCTGSALAIGTAKDLGTGSTQYNIYDGSCKTLQSLQVNNANGVCDSQYFLCALATKNIEAYDDPTSGVSYVCTADTSSETCAGDAVSLCVSVL
ncbi:hypothetical protein DHEL01_v213112 [Diaporthe helianthi]|uniref:Uncharacterized protein n=1 Tax=Diaporthe helianthi TaxID=158607 RepID=A0A2P5HE07_DIAHE|nr:hypothetical protein DHEL01_v213112 [Diaporthe helianthi]